MPPEAQRKREDTKPRRKQTLRNHLWKPRPQSKPKESPQRDEGDVGEQNHPVSLLCRWLHKSIH